MKPFDSVVSAWEWGCDNSNCKCEMLVTGGVFSRPDFKSEGLYILTFPGLFFCLDTS